MLSVPCSGRHHSSRADTSDRASRGWHMDDAEASVGLCHVSPGPHLSAPQAEATDDLNGTACLVRRGTDPC